MKKSRLIILIFTIIGNLFSFEIDGVEYKILSKINRTVGVIQYKGDYDRVDIPANISYLNNNYSVSSIGEQAFIHTKVKSVIIPNSVTIIENGAFSFCDSLKNIQIGDSVKVIGVCAFAYCTRLRNLIIPSSVTTIRDYAFTSSGLISIIIPNNVTNIGYSIFATCFSLEYIYVQENNTNYTSIDGVFYDKKATTLLQYPCGKKGDFIIPSSVTTIRFAAFSWCRKLTKVTIPNSVTSIEWGAFSYCDSLKDLIIPSTVTSIERLTFAGCSRLEEITIPNSVTTIGEQAFDNSDRLRNVTLGNSVKSIGKWAFTGCIRIEYINSLSKNPPSLGSFVFVYCTPKQIKLKVPNGYIELYKATDQWKDFNILEF